MLINDLRTQILQAELLGNQARNVSIRMALAPCTPEEDCDRFELWSNGFNARLNANPRDGAREKIRDRFTETFREGWFCCDRLLCPELYQPSFEDRLREMALDWTNNFITVQAFADYYHLSHNLALGVIQCGRFLNEMEANQHHSS